MLTVAKELKKMAANIDSNISGKMLHIWFLSRFTLTDIMNLKFFYLI